MKKTTRTHFALLDRRFKLVFDSLFVSSQVLWVTMDEVAFDFMDELAPGCIAMFPSDGSVSLDKCPFQVPLSQLSLLNITKHNK